MGDVRFLAKLDALRRARDRWGAIRAMSDVDLTQGLAAISPDDEPYLANVIATELSNRIARKNAVLETMVDGVVLVDARGVILYMNPAARELLVVEEGLKLSEQLRSPDIRDAIERALRSSSAIDIDAAEVRERDGEARYLALTARPVVREEQVEGVLLAVQDVTARRFAEDLLRQKRLEESERRYRRIFDERIEDLFTEHLGAARATDSRPPSPPRR